MVKNGFRFKLGCDPELFLVDYNGQLRASCGLIGGTKVSPQPITGLGEGFAIQEDNVAVEFNIPPAETMREFVDNVHRTIKVINDGINATLGYTIDYRSAAYFPKEELTAPAAKEFGCDPDFNAWTGQQNPKPKADDETLRSCGGHIHVGFDVNQLNRERLMKCMDLCLGVPSVVMDDGELRKKLYGKPGAYRPKSKAEGAYDGAEYRVLSNFWVKHPKLTEWAWMQTAEAIKLAQTEFPIDAYRHDIESVINKNDKAAAWLMAKEIGLKVITSEELHV